MEITNSIDEFASWIGEITGCEVEETDDNFIYKIDMPYDEDEQIILSKENLANEISMLENFNPVSETVISTDNSYEVLVRDEGRSFRLELNRNANEINTRDEDTLIVIEDTENGLTYSLGRPTNQFVLFLVKNAALYGDPKAISRNSPRISTKRFLRSESPYVLDYLKRFVAGQMTLKVTSTTRKSVSDFDKFCSAFLFNITYNTDTALIQQRDFEELLRTGRIRRNRRSNPSQIDPPRRTYILDLIHHYQLAVGTENPMLEYISYYHVIEHFLEIVFNEALVEKIKNKLTHPDFSYKRQKDISSLIKEVADSIKIRDESITFNEKEALGLTLQKYLDISELVTKLNEYDSTLVNYYKSNPVSFASAIRVNLEDNNEDIIYRNLAARIYQTRNSIVHSKESDKAKYTPFRDDKILVKEVPLLRFIAERIIFETSTIL